MTSIFKRSALCALAASSAICIAAFAQTLTAPKPAAASAPPVAASSAVAAEWINGEITKIDMARARITLKHEPIPSLKMDAMTMPFKLKDKALLDGRKVGEKVQFAVRVDDGDLFVMQIRSRP